MADGRHPLELTRDQILAHRRQVQALDRRLSPGQDSLRRAAAPGLQDSVPRSALHALHARVQDVAPDAWEDPSLVQVWGPRHVAYVVPEGEHLPFTLGRLPETGRIRARAEDLARRMEAHLAGRRLPMDAVGEALGVHPNALRYASLTGTVLIRWDGARQATLRTVPRARLSPAEALQQLVRRHLHFLGPSTVDTFARWGGVDRARAAAAFAALALELLAVRTPLLGECWILAEDEPAFRAAPAAPPADARLLPSGDPYYLLWGADRDLLVPDARRRDELWTSRVWPGALLVRGEVAGTWRRAKNVVEASPWRRLSDDERRAVEREAASLPLPEVTAPATVRWTA
ncbi:MAG TPA: crosslink repair DNA glycosylase YcaQ family protein [candidate division Zixibacteria bacterium]|nr:crosslink repair DNA glycosylase YcaQ family protein [candidate division Zixibacteria bacterium]